ncbi:MAG: hypothetical protein ACPGJL_04020 [Acholeplasmataceae bacterium]
MKLRLSLSVIILILVMILYPSLLILLEPYGQGIVTVILICILAMLSFFVFSGVQKLLVYTIYIGITLLFLFLFPADYQVLIGLIASLIMIIHPLSKFEFYLSKKMSPSLKSPIRIHLSGSYWPYFEYRKAMKAYYHLPQSKKLHKNKWYLLSRQLTTLGLLFAGIFLIINETSNIVNALNAFSFIRFFNLYIVFLLILMSYYAYKKGFTTVIRALMIGILPMIIYILLTASFDAYLRLPMLLMVSTVFAFIFVFEYQRYYDRVTIDVFDYHDEENNRIVYANSLFEPIIYNDTYILSSHYLIKISLTTFHKHLHEILKYMNKHHLILTAYAYGEQMFHLYADFHFKDREKVDLFKTFLESLFTIGIPFELQEDKHKLLYEKKFYHQPAYIIARARHLARQLEDVSNEKIIIVSVLMYFENKNMFSNVKKSYTFTYIESMSMDAYHTIKIDVPVPNNGFVVETTVKDILSVMSLNKGHFIRILISKII